MPKQMLKRNFISELALALGFFLLLSGCHSTPPAPSGPVAENNVSRADADEPAKTPVPERTFRVLVYNVENLFDWDGVALFDDYRPAANNNPYGYRLAHFRTKVRNIVEVVKSIDDGKGPDIILFQELEGDQTPGPEGDAGLLKTLAAKPDRPTVEALLSDEGKLTEFWRTLPAYAWLALALEDAGLTYPQVASADYAPPASADEGPAHANAVFSRYPIVAARSHPLMKARSILETEIEIDGHILTIFNNHWKSGASDPATEVIRIQNASVLRDRLDDILEKNPQQDILIAGDFNSHYNQRWLFPDWSRTAINDVLGSQGDETALLEAGSSHLYNLWYELPFEGRGSELYQGYWGTLMQIILTPGLYDRRGIQYVDQSFRVVKLEGRNVEPVFGAPFRWTAVGEGAGYSDHFPVLAEFRTVTEPGEGFVRLENPSRTRSGPDQQPKGEYASLDPDQVIDLMTFGNLKNFSRAENLGKLVQVRGTVRDGRRLMLETGLGPIELWIPDKDYRERFKRAYGVSGKEVELTGMVGWFKGRWQIELADPAWGPSI